MTSLLILGVDPGKSGGLALVGDEKRYMDRDGGTACVVTPGVVEAYKMPDTELDVLELIQRLALRAEKAWVEHVHAMPGQGVTSTFTFGAGYGGLRMALMATGIPFETVRPAKWQGALGCRTKGDKNVSKRRAQELFGGKVRVTHAVADALLIAEYGRRMGGE